MLRSLIYPKIKGFITAVANKLARAGVTPDHLTFTGAAISLVAAFAYSFGYFFIGGLLILAAGACDMLDGALARAKSIQSPFGAFLDSTIDRYSDLLILGGIAVFFAANGSIGTLVLVLVALAGSFLTSYTKARSESLIPKCDVGLIERPERIIIIAIGSLPNLLVPAMWLLAITSHVTVIQRVVYVRKKLRKESE